MQKLWLVTLFALLPAAAMAQEKTADNMAILREKLRADKKLVVAEAMPLTEAEAKAFWPVYEAYQNEQSALNTKVGQLITDYAASYKSMTDPTAKSLVDTMVKLEQDRVALMQSYLPKFRAVLSETKVARYYQIENKIRAVINYELASAIPLLK